MIAGFSASFAGYAEQQDFLIRCETILQFARPIFFRFLYTNRDS